MNYVERTDYIERILQADLFDDSLSGCIWDGWDIRDIIGVLWGDENSSNFERFLSLHRVL